MPGAPAGGREGNDQPGKTERHAAQHEHHPQSKPSGDREVHAAERDPAEAQQHEDDRAEGHR